MAKSMTKDNLHLFLRFLGQDDKLTEEETKQARKLGDHSSTMEDVALLLENTLQMQDNLNYSLQVRIGIMEILFKQLGVTDDQFKEASIQFANHQKELDVKNDNQKVKEEVVEEKKEE